MLIVCCGMPRSGSTLQYQIACELVERAALGTRPAAWPSPIDPSMWAGPRPIHIAKTHDPDPRLAGFDPRHTRFVYAYRDVRDAIASHLQKIADDAHPGIDDADIARVVRERMLDPFAHFTTMPGVLVSRYERMIDDLPEEIRRIARHIGIEPDAETTHAIAEALALDTQRRFLSARPWHTGEAWDDRTLLHRHHIRDGRVGKFRDVLTPAQLDAVEAIARQWLLAQGYPVGGTALQGRA